MGGNGGGISLLGVDTPLSPDFASAGEAGEDAYISAAVIRVSYNLSSVPLDCASVSSLPDTAVVLEEDYEEEPVEETYEEEPVEEYYGDYIPTGSDVATKPWMDFRAVTDTSSVQYSLISQAVIEADGRLTIDGYTLVAMGANWGYVGEKMIAIIGGREVPIIKADEKQNRHTLNGEGWYGMDGHVLECIVDTNSLEEMALVMGDCDYLPHMNGIVSAIVKGE